MAGDYEDVTLVNLNNGAAVELFDLELRRVIENIEDENVKPDAVREITLKVTIKPNEDRDLAAVAISCKSKLAATKPHGHYMTLVYDGNKTRAMTTHIEQPELDLGDGNITKMGDRT